MQDTEYNALVAVLILKDPVRAAYLLEQGVSAYPLSVELWSQGAVYYAGMGEKDRALFYATRALELNPSLNEEFETFKIQLERL